MYLTDPKTGEKSITMTMMAVTFGVCLLKLLLSGASYGDFSMGVFPASEFAICVGTCGSIYGFRKHTDKKSKK